MCSMLLVSSARIILALPFNKIRVRASPFQREVSNGFHFLREESGQCRVSDNENEPLRRFDRFPCAKIKARLQGSFVFSALSIPSYPMEVLFIT